MKIFSAQLKGTTTVISGSTASITGSFTGSIAGIDINATNTFTASTNSRLALIETITSSNVSRINNLESFTSSTSARLNSIEIVSASNVSRINSLESFSSSIYTTNTFTSSATARLNSIETISASNIARLNSLENKTGSLATTGSNTFIGTQIITGSLFVQNNLVVQGSSSLQNITASAVSIGTNTVLLNTATPSIRFAGISAIDSGSAAGTSGSLYFDSTDNEWIFVHQGNIAVTSSTMITGPETYDSVGNETRLTTNIIPKSTNGFHITDSCLFDNGTTTCVKNNFVSTGTGVFCGQLNSITGVFGSKGGGNYGVLISDNDQSNVRLRFTNSGTGGQSMSIVGGNPGLSNYGLAFYDETNTCTRMYISSNGNIGINSGTPLSKVYISHGGNNPVGCAGDYCIDAIVLEGGGGRSGIRSIQHDAGNQPAAGDLQFLNFYYNGSTYNWYERMRIRATGNVGINTTTPNSLLHIEASNNTTNQFRVNSCDGLNAGVRSYTTSDGAGLIINHYYAVSGNPYLRTSDFVSNQGDAAATQMRFFTKAYNANAALAMIVSSGGCVGINTSNPGSLLDVQNCINVPYDSTNTLVSNQWFRTSNLSACTGASSGIIFVAQGPSGGNGLATINGVTTSCGSMAITFGTRNASGAVSEKMRIVSSGTIGVGTDAPLTHAGANVGGLVIKGLNSCRGIIELWDGNTSGKAVFQQVNGTTYLGNLDKGAGTGELQLLVNGNGGSATTAMTLTKCGHIVVNNSPNSQTDYGRFTISTSTVKTDDPNTQEKTVLHLSTCESDYPFGMKFQLVGGTCTCTRYVAMQTGDHYISNQGNIAMQVSGGHVGIGTTDIGYKLTVFNTDSANTGLFRLYASSGAYTATMADIGSESNSSSYTLFNVRYGSGMTNTAFKVRGDGNVGVGTTNAYAKLTVNGTIANPSTVGGDNFTIDTMNGYQSIANGGYVDFNGMSGFLMVNNWSNGAATLFVMGGGNTGVVGTITGTAGTTHHNPAVGGYRWCNNYGSTANFGFQVFRTRNTA